MLRKTGALVFCVALIIYLTTIMAETEPQDMTPFANNAFALKMYDVLRKTQGNVFFSPYSLQVALAMTYSGASGKTASQIQKSVSFTENKDVLYKAVQDTTNNLTSNKDVTLNVANGVYVQQNYAVKETFTNRMKEVFKAEAKALDFEKNTEAASEINNFVKKQTNGKITDLFSADAFGALTRLVLVNAVYFKGTWVNQFDPNDTYKGDFNLNKKDKVKVDFMKITKKFNALEEDSLNATLVELPYNGDLSMVVIVPNDIEGIKQLEEKMKNADLKDLTQRAYSREVQLALPKFKLEQKYELNEPLKQIGIQDMFDQNKAEFDGVTDRKDLYVSQVVQKAFIEVNEEGSEAAAATGVVMMAAMIDLSPPIKLIADRPFIFLIYHTQTGLPVFMGRFSGF